jgi:glycosyltransferase involved in cell wall biosynthesis
MNSSLSIFFPFYNDAGTVELMISHAYYYGNQCTKDLEVVAVNDGSIDSTLDELYRMQKIYPDLKIINHEKNKGYGGALISAINHTTKHWVFYTDGDAQYRLDELPNLWWYSSGERCDVVNGFKISRSDNLIRQLIGKTYQWSIRRIFKIPIRDVDCDFRLMKGDILRSLNLHCQSGAITVELVKKLNEKTTNFRDLPVRHYERIYGKSMFFTFSNIVNTLKDELKLLKELRR